MTAYILELLLWLAVAIPLGLALRPYLHGKGRRYGHQKRPE